MKLFKRILAWIIVVAFVLSTTILGIVAAGSMRMATFIVSFVLLGSGILIWACRNLWRQE